MVVCALACAYHAFVQSGIPSTSRWFGTCNATGVAKPNTILWIEQSLGPSSGHGGQPEQRCGPGSQPE
eukprot:354567-Chlamydomonas_euryale.AAC.4